MLSRLSVKSSCKMLLRTSSVVQKTRENRGLHHACKTRNVLLKNDSLLNVHKLSNRFAVFTIRHDSTATGADNLLNNIPDPPKLPVEEIIETIAKVHPNGEPTLESLGLANFTGPGLVERMLEILHIDCCLPWWGTIAVATILAKLVTFPITLIANKNSSVMQNHIPEIQSIQAKMSEARRSGNSMDVAIYGHQLNELFKEKGINPMKNAITMLVQTPIFFSYFLALRKMATIPVESFKEGGLWWFTNLTVADPYYALPVITSVTLFVTIRISMSAGTTQGPLLNLVMQALPIVILPFMLKMPAAVLCYWVTSNFMTLLQSSLLRVNAVRGVLHLPPLITHDKSKLPQKKKGFIEGLKDSITNIKIARELEDRQRADKIQFSKAGRGTTVKTYSFDPTKQPQDLSSIHAKKR